MPTPVDVSLEEVLKNCARIAGDIIGTMLVELAVQTAATQQRAATAPQEPDPPSEWGPEHQKVRDDAVAAYRAHNGGS